MNLLVRAFKKYGDFTGRSSRREFWLVAALFVVATLTANFLDSLDGPRRIVAARMGAAELAVSIALFLPFVSAGARRLHDSDRSGWWLMLIYLPYLGWVATEGNARAQLLCLGALALGAVSLIAMLLMPRNPGPNRFGERNP